MGNLQRSRNEDDDPLGKELVHYAAVHEACEKFFGKDVSYRTIATLFPNKTSTGIDWPALNKELARREWVLKTDLPTEGQRSAMKELAAINPKHEWCDDDYLNRTPGSRWPSENRIRCHILLSPQSKLNALLKEIKRLYEEQFLRKSDLGKYLWLLSYVQYHGSDTMFDRGYKVPDEECLNTVVAIGRAREQEFILYCHNNPTVYSDVSTAETVGTLL